jgi:outer membrane protein assembly factor BamA
MTGIPVQSGAVYRIFIFFFCIFSPVIHGYSMTGLPVAPDTVRPVVIRAIVIEGNRQTRPQIILRELPFREHDTLPLNTFSRLLSKGRENIFNTRLFNFVTVDTAMNGGGIPGVDVRIHVIERWYIWPWPYFEISDRNLNAWLETTDWSRLTYGIDLTFFNVRGRNETLILPVHLGFNQMYGFFYRVPYINRKQTFGLGFGATILLNHEEIVTSEDNKTIYCEDENGFLQKELNGYFDLLLRPTFYSTHTFHVSYRYFFFAETLSLIPGYLPERLSQTGCITLSYQFKNDHRDVHFYPLKGSYFDVEIVKDGLFGEPLNDFYITSSFRKYWHIFNRWYLATGLSGKVTLTKDQPYILQRGLGYGREYVRGYEYFVVDGQHFILMKNNVKFAILPQRVFRIGFIESTRFNAVPYALYLNVFTDLGYVYNRDEYANRENSLQNSLLVGYGAGFDFTTYYDIVVRLECAINGMGQPGLYVHFMAPI